MNHINYFFINQLISELTYATVPTKMEPLYVSRQEITAIFCNSSGCLPITVDHIPQALWQQLKMEKKQPQQTHNSVW